MSRCYGTPDTCEKMNKLLKEEKAVCKDSHSSSTKITEYANNNMKLRTDLKLGFFAIEHYWLTKCKDLLSKGKNKMIKNKYKELKDDMTNWKLEDCLSVITSATHVDGTFVFKSPLVDFSEDTSSQYDFVVFANKTRSLLNFHVTSNSKELFKQEFLSFLEFLSDLKKWFHRYSEDFKAPGTAYKESSQCYMNLFYPQLRSSWSCAYERLRELDFETTSYILISTLLQFEKLTENQKKTLSSIPWSCVVDYDPNSSKEGFLKSFQHFQAHKIDYQRKSYSEIEEIDYNHQYDDSVSKLTLGYKCFWFLPHGDVEDGTDKSCPICDEDLYVQKVRGPLKDVISFILKCLKKSRKPPVVVFLHYNEFAIVDDQQSQSFVIKSLQSIYDRIIEIIGRKHVLIFTDKKAEKDSFAQIADFDIPLPLLCHMLMNTNEDCDYELPVLLPTSTGRIKINNEGSQNINLPRILEDFELVHIKIHKHELHDMRKCETITKAEGNEDFNLDGRIVANVTQHFLRGNQISWIGIKHGIHIKRDLFEKVIKKLKHMQPEKAAVDVPRITQIFELYHEVGAGASTLARCILWELRKDFICLIMRENFVYSPDTVDHLTTLYKKCNRTILLLVDEDIQQYNTKSLTYQIQSLSVPLILFRVIRVLQKKKHVQQSEQSLFLTCNLNKNEESALKERYAYAFPQEVEKGRMLFSAAKAFSSIGERVSANDEHWSSCRCNNNVHNENGIVLDCPNGLLRIKWDDGSIGMCSIDTVCVTNVKGMHSFIYYGIYFLVKEYREYIKDHIMKKLSELIHQNKEGMLFLAYISLLFAYNTCYCLPQVCFSNGAETFSVLNKVPVEAHDFISENSIGLFRIVHPIVAKQIIDYYVNQEGHSRSQLVIKFLNKYIKSHQQANLELRQVVSTLLWKRPEIEDSSERKNERKKIPEFSPLICELQCDDAIKVLRKGVDIFNSSHAYGHLARYYAIQLKDFDQAKGCMEKALGCAANDHSKGTMYNIYGDIYRYELVYRLHESCGVDKTLHDENILHSEACKMYKCSSGLQRSVSHPYHGELKVRLKYLQHIKNSKFPGDRNDSSFLKYLVSDSTVLNSDGRCIELLEWLKDFATNGDGGKDAGINYKLMIEKHWQTLHEIMGKNKRAECIGTIENLLKYPDTEINHPALRRKYVYLHLIREDNDLSEHDWLIENLSEEKRHKLSEYLQLNIKEEGYKFDTMKNWLKFVCTLPLEVEYVLQILQKLEHDMPPLNDGISSPEEVTFIKFYLYVFNFLLALECSSTVAPQRFYHYKERYDCEEQACRASTSEKTKHWIKKSLADNSSRTNCLVQGNHHNLQTFKGKIGEIQDKKGRISFNGFSIFFDKKDLKSDNGISYYRVKFNICFTYSGVRAINISKIQGETKLTDHPSSPAVGFSSDFMTTPQSFNNQGMFYCVTC